MQDDQRMLKKEHVCHFCGVQCWGWMERQRLIFKFFFKQSLHFSLLSNRRTTVLGLDAPFCKMFWKAIYQNDVNGFFFIFSRKNLHLYNQIKFKKLFKSNSFIYCMISWINTWFNLASSAILDIL